nr:immunoglobulin light chain junction region [Macaca mulatta]
DYYCYSRDTSGNGLF